MSTSIAVVKRNASKRTGIVCATFNVPGMSRSAIFIFKALNIATVGAKEPIPNVSKKSVTKPVSDAFQCLIRLRKFRLSLILLSFTEYNAKKGN